MSTPEEPYTDEIDLVELLSVLWSGKWWILAITGVALVGAFSWLSLTQPSYESEAIITAPARADYNAMYPGLLGDKAPNPQQVLSQVMSYLSSADEQRKFLANRIETETQDDGAVSRAVERLEVTEKEGGILQSPSINVRYTAADPEQTRTVIEGYVARSNEGVVEELARSANNRIKKQASSLANQIEEEKGGYRKKLEQKIAQLEASRKRARANGIKTNQHNNSSSLLLSNQLQASEKETTSFKRSILQQPLFEYGTRALSALVENHKQQLQQLSSKAIQLQSRKESWENLNIRTENADALAVYQSASEAEPTRSGILVMAMAGFLGVILGIILTLGQSAWKNSISRHQPE